MTQDDDRTLYSKRIRLYYSHSHSGDTKTFIVILISLIIIGLIQNIGVARGGALDARSPQGKKKRFWGQI